jgi:hypothetical protein
LSFEKVEAKLCKKEKEQKENKKERKKTGSDDSECRG